MTFQIGDDYVDVAERIRLAKEKWPEMTLQAVNLEKPYELITIAGKDFVVYAAALYRTPDDPRPSIGVAWEPVPGPTPFTRESELMNAETSAWGRAIIAAGIPSKKIASREEVQARSGSSAQSTANTEDDRINDEEEIDPWTGLPVVRNENYRQIPAAPSPKRNCEHGAMNYWESKDGEKKRFYCPLPDNDPRRCKYVAV